MPLTIAKRFSFRRAPHRTSRWVAAPKRREEQLEQLQHPGRGPLGAQPRTPTQLGMFSPGPNCLRIPTWRVGSTWTIGLWWITTCWTCWLMMHRTNSHIGWDVGIRLGISQLLVKDTNIWDQHLGWGQLSEGHRGNPRIQRYGHKNTNCGHLAT